MVDWGLFDQEGAVRQRFLDIDDRTDDLREQVERTSGFDPFLEKHATVLGYRRGESPFQAGANLEQAAGCFDALEPSRLDRAAVFELPAVRAAAALVRVGGRDHDDATGLEPLSTERLFNLTGGGR